MYVCLHAAFLSLHEGTHSDAHIESEDKDGCTRTVTDKSRKNKHRMTNGKKHADQVEPSPPPCSVCLCTNIKTSKSKLIWPLSPNTSYFLIDKCSHLPPTSSILSHFSYSLPLPFI